ncbi:T9SS type A sorting domain-containing protein [candidate division WOR-3 bacterium]|nr:T9SS type A sorting domain-containing protein [candidate division WOR-3 bacterium]
MYKKNLSLIFIFVFILSVSLAATNTDIYPSKVEKNLSSLSDTQFDTSLEKNANVNPVKKFPGIADSVLIGGFDAPGPNSRGCTFCGTYLWSADDATGMIYKLDAATGSVLGSYTSPGGGGAGGLTWDGFHLWHNNYLNDMIYKIDTTSMAVVKSFAVPGSGMMFDLAFDGENLYGAVGNDGYILGFDTTSGAITDSIHATYSSGNVRPFGLAYLASGTAGELWTSDGNYGSNMVNLWDFATTSWVDQWSSSPATYPCGIAYDPVSGYMWISCWTTDSIYIFDVGPTVDVEEKPVVRKPVFRLAPNVPNPVANGKTTIAYTTTKTGTVSLKIYDSAGRLVKTLIDWNEDAGVKNVYWDCTDNNHQPVSAGVYFCRLNSEKRTATNKIVVVR